jgi:hypothetical protein
MWILQILRTGRCKSCCTNIDVLTLSKSGLTAFCAFHFDPDSDFGNNVRCNHARGVVLRANNLDRGTTL